MSTVAAINDIWSRLDKWREQVRLRHIEQEIDQLRIDIEDAYLHLNSLIRQKAAMEIEQFRLEIQVETD